MLLTESRRAARVTADGDLVRLRDQDRSLWDPALVAEGHALVRRCLRRNRPGPYQLQAAIAAVHADAATPEGTDWVQIVTLYDHLYALAPTPVVALNRAIALGQVDGPEDALAAVDALGLDTYHLWHATRGDLLARLGRHEEAAAAFTRATGLTDNAAERRLLADRAATGR
jgi:RNA polymerase sigma-70 factor (ECF subfamily)